MQSNRRSSNRSDGAAPHNASDAATHMRGPRRAHTACTPLQCHCTPLCTTDQVTTPSGARAPTSELGSRPVRHPEFVAHGAAASHPAWCATAPHHIASACTPSRPIACPAAAQRCCRPPVNPGPANAGCVCAATSATARNPHGTARLRAVPLPLRCLPLPPCDAPCVHATPRLPYKRCARPPVPRGCLRGGRARALAEVRVPQPDWARKRESRSVKCKGGSERAA